MCDTAQVRIPQGVWLWEGMGGKKVLKKQNKTKAESSHIVAEAQIDVGVFLEPVCCRLTAGPVRHALMTINRDLALWRK